MAENKRYYIKVGGNLAEVSAETYFIYYKMARRERAQAEKDARHGKVSYSDLDTNEMVAEEMIPDHSIPCVEDAAIRNILKEKLRRCLALLSPSERELIHAIYFEGLSERQLSKRTGIHHMTLHSRKIKILAKLKTLMDQ